MFEWLICQESKSTEINWSAISPFQDMDEVCAPACQSCEKQTIEGRCPIDPDAPVAWEKGSLNQMFEKLTQEPYLSEYGVEVLSSPATNGPWVITMENVISADEAEQLIELGGAEGYERSEDVGKMRADGTIDRYEDYNCFRVRFVCLHDMP